MGILWGWLQSRLEVEDGFEEKRAEEMRLRIQGLVVAALREELERVWSAETSVSLSWTPAAPSRGQCTVTALVVQDELGGVLLRKLVNGESHYFNRLDDGTEVDLTRDQFPADATESEPQERSRDYVLAFVHTRTRYEILRARLEAARGDREG